MGMKEKDTKQTPASSSENGGVRTQTVEPTTATEAPTSPEVPQVERRNPNASPIPPARERRKYKVSETPPPPPPPPKLNDYEPIIGKAAIDELHFLERHLRG